MQPRIDAKRVIVINDGRLILDQPVNQLRSGLLKRKLVTLLTDAETLSLSLPGVEMKEQSPYRTVLEVNTDQTPIQAVIQACLAQARLRDLSVEDPPMDEVVQRIYAGRAEPDIEHGKEADHA